jgi:hypothetical protein
LNGSETGRFFAGSAEAGRKSQLRFLTGITDCIQIYARPDGDGNILLTDDGYTVSDLMMSGCDINTPKRNSIFHEILKGFGVQCENGRLEISGTKSLFPQKKHNLIQAMFAVGDMFYLAAPYVESLFFEKVIDWMDSLCIRYTPKITFKGKSGFSYQFHAVIPKSKRAPERIIQAVNHPDKESVRRLVFE